MWLSGLQVVVASLLLIFLCVRAEEFDKVDVLVCIETLCPDSKKYIITELDPTYIALRDIIELTFVPYGNAVINEEEHTVECQHYEEECSANSYEQCAIYYYPEPEQYLPFATCLAAVSNEDLVTGDEQIFEDCAVQSSLDWPLIRDCHDDEKLSWDLQVDAAIKTPDYHTYVPWTEVNGEVINWFDGEELGRAICGAYEGYYSKCYCSESDLGSNIGCSLKNSEERAYAEIQ